MALKWMNNAVILVEKFEGIIDFGQDFGLELEGRATIEGE